MDNPHAAPAAHPSLQTVPQAQHLLIAVMACAILPLFVYSNSFNIPFFYDDIPNIVRNPDIRDLATVRERLVYVPEDKPAGFWKHNNPTRPLTYLSFALNYRLGELEVAGYHAVNLDRKSTRLNSSH